MLGSKKSFLLLSFQVTFITALIAANITAVKIVMIMGVVVPAGVLSYALTFAMTDVISEVWGKTESRRLVFGGLLALLLFWILLSLALILPPAPFWENQEIFSKILQTSFRITTAGILAYFASQSLDLWLFHLLRHRQGEKGLWLRNNLSTLCSQTLDTTLFITLAFYGLFPILPLIAGQLLFKALIALVDTPLVYLLVGLARRFEEKSFRPS